MWLRIVERVRHLFEMCARHIDDKGPLDDDGVEAPEQTQGHIRRGHRRV